MEMEKAIALSYAKNAVNNARVTSPKTMEIKFNWCRAQIHVYFFMKENCIINKYVTFSFLKILQRDNALKIYKNILFSNIFIRSFDFSI